MSDGGLVTEAKPSIQWDKVKITLLIMIQGDKGKYTVFIILIIIMAGQRCYSHTEVGLWSGLER